MSSSLSLSQLFDLPQERAISQRLEPHQGFHFRALHRARALSRHLIDDTGQFQTEFLERAILLLEKEGYIFYPNSPNDALITEHLLHTLRQLRHPQLLTLLQRFQAPVCHLFAGRLVLQTLAGKGDAPTTAEIRRAALCAALTCLRQRVGSCFATAPAILIQREQLPSFFTDLFELLFIGRLKRTFEGIEYAVPLSFYSSNDLLCENALLCAWEFTLASFSEVKMEFSTWNLYQSLGFSSAELGGIGELLYRHIQERVEEENRAIEKHQHAYEQAFAEARSVEILLKSAQSESAARRFTAEYQSRIYHMRACEELRDQTHAQAKRLSGLHHELVKLYSAKFPAYFQEIYDASMRDFSKEKYEDSPAGFRLLYKHGRQDPSLWTLIHKAEEYIASLSDFFIMTEGQILAELGWKEGEKEVIALISKIVQHIRSEPFLKSALKRMKRAHSSLALPWAYLSGGTMTTLLKTYFCRTKELTEEARWVESPSELAIFLIDTLKALPPRLTHPYIKEPTKRMLISSPSHAFLLLPGETLFKKGWQAELFTYTWVRDEIIHPARAFYAALRLSQGEQSFLFETLLRKLSPEASYLLQRYPPISQEEMSIITWREKVASLFARLPPSEEQKARVLCDALLYRALPLIPAGEEKAQLLQLLAGKGDRTLQQKIEALPALAEEYVTAEELQARAMVCLAPKTGGMAYDLHRYIADRARSLGLLAPSPLLIADSNWTQPYLGFLVNPGTGELELWRVSAALNEGTPMSEWEHFLNGAEKKPWVVYPNAFEYLSDSLQ